MTVIAYFLPRTMASKQPEKPTVQTASDVVQSFFSPPLTFFGDWPLPPLPPLDSNITQDDECHPVRDEEWPWGYRSPKLPRSRSAWHLSTFEDREVMSPDANGSTAAYISLVWDGKDYCTRVHGQSGLETYQRWRNVLDNSIAREIQACIRVMNTIKLGETPQERERREWVPLQMSYNVMQRLVSLVEPGSVPADIIAEYSDSRTALIALDEWVVQHAHFEWRDAEGRNWA